MTTRRFTRAEMSTRFLFRVVSARVLELAGHLIRRVPRLRRILKMFKTICLISVARKATIALAMLSLTCTGFAGGEDKLQNI